jgi:hypothetical protein
LPLFLLNPSQDYWADIPSKRVQFHSKSLRCLV